MIIIENNVDTSKINMEKVLQLVEILKKELNDTNLGIIALNSEIEKAKEELEKTIGDLKNANNELEQFAYIVSHDLQEPLRTISGFAGLLIRRYLGQIDSDAQDFLTYIIDGVKRMQNLLNDILTYSRITTKGHSFKNVNANECLGNVLKSLSLYIQENNAKITYDPLPTVMADGTQLEQLFQNLITNAIKFHGSNPPHVHISGIVKEKEWLFSVQDNGIGIDPKYFEQIFIIFQRLHKKEEFEGTGIGLAVSKKIVQRHGGKIWVESELGKGSTFFFSIDRSIESQT